MPEDVRKSKHIRYRMTEFADLGDAEDVETIIADAIIQFDANSGSYDAEDGVNDALYFIMMSPNYMIQK